MSTDPAQGPIPVATPVGESSPVLGYAGVVDVEAWPRTRRALAVVLWLGGLATFAAPFCIVVLDVETVLATGPLLALCGLAGVFLAGRVGDRLAVWLGAVLLVAPIGAFTMIWWNGWGPGESRVPLLFVSGACCIVVTAFAAHRLQRRRADGAT